MAAFLEYSSMNRRLGRLSVRPPDVNDTKQDHGQAQNLPHGHPIERDKSDVRIRFASKLHQETEGSVPKQEKRTNTPCGPRLG